MSGSARLWLRVQATGREALPSRAHGALPRTPARLRRNRDTVRYCGTLVSWLLRERPPDELHLLVVLVVPGCGKRLLAEPG